MTHSLPYNSCDVLVKNLGDNLILQVIDKSGRVICERNTNQKAILVKLPFCNGYTIQIDGKAQLHILPIKRFAKPKDRSEFDFITNAFELSKNIEKLPVNREIQTKEGHKFTLLEEIKGKDGSWLNTPCMVFSKSHKIWIDKRFVRESKMTANELVAALAHEHGHIVGNKKSGAPDSDETSADINGLLLFCSYGFGPTDYYRSFRKTFKTNDTVENRHRIKVLHEVAKNLQSGKIYKPIYQ